MFSFPRDLKEPWGLALPRDLEAGPGPGSTDRTLQGGDFSALPQLLPDMTQGAMVGSSLWAPSDLRHHPHLLPMTEGLRV